MAEKEDAIGTIVLGASEIAKLLLVAYFSLSRMQQMTPEEIEAEMKVELEKFKLRDPADIPEFKDSEG